VTFPAARFDEIFAELHGFVLLDPARLPRQRNLLELFVTTDEADGIAVPLLDVEAGWYSVSVEIRSQGDGAYEFVLSSAAAGISSLPNFSSADTSHTDGT
jgi:hypothetical protein